MACIERNPGGPVQKRAETKIREPVSETFIMRPGISVTATFGTNGRITEFLIYPQDTGVVKFSRANSLSIDSVKAIIDELVPAAVRGQHVISTFLNVDCLPANDCNGASEKYERATIYYNSTAVKERVHYAVVNLRK